MFTKPTAGGCLSLRAIIRSKAKLVSFLGMALTASLFAFAMLSGTASAAPMLTDGSSNYAFTTLDDQADPTFNQLLGINDYGTIAGYFGSGQPGHPNKGYELLPPYGQSSYRNENFPGSTQTQVTGLNNQGITVGFWVDASGNNHGFYAVHRHHFHTADFPTRDMASPQVDQLLGVNDNGVAVGFYTDKSGINHGYLYNIRRHRYQRIGVPGDTNVTAAAINDLGDVAGFATNASGTVEAFLRQAGGGVIKLNVPGATATQAFGVNDGDEVVGSYSVGSGSSAVTHGFVWAPGFGFETVDDPNGVGGTTINGVNDRGELVGFYTDAAGNTDGLLAQPQN